jgi:hypothetical protein
VSALLLLGAALVAHAHGDVVELRGGATAIDGEVLSASAAGVTVRSRKGGLEQTRTVPWADVRDVRGDGLPADLGRWLPAGESLWRARSRAIRGDWPFALPEFERAFATWSGAQPCRDAVVAAAGLAEARVRSGDLAGAVVPAFEAIRLTRAAPAADSSGALDGLEVEAIDPRVPVPPFVAPFVLEPAKAAAACEGLRALGLDADPALAGVVEAWCAAAGAPGRPGPDATDARAASKADAAARAAASALEALAALRSSDADGRGVAVAAVARARAGMPAWFDAWARGAIGLALATDPDDAVRARGCALLASVVAIDSVSQPALAAFARDALDAAIAGRGPRSASSLAAALAAHAPRAATAVPRDAADRTAAVLELAGDRRVLIAHLEAQVEQELPGEAREAAVGRLARVLAVLLEREKDPEGRASVAARAAALLRTEDAIGSGSVALRMSLLRARHRAAQRVAEERRAGRVPDADAESARKEFGELVREFTALASLAAKAGRRADSDAVRAAGLTAEQAAAEGAMAEDAVRNAQYFRAWAAYYEAWLARDLGREGWRQGAQSSLDWFAALIEPGRPSIDPKEVSVDLRGNEGFASSILGMALSSGMVASAATSDAWFALLDDPRTHPSVRLKLPAWRLAADLDRADAASALRILRAEGDGPQGIPMSLIAAARSVRMPPGDDSASLLTESVGRLASAGRLGDLAAIGDAGGGASGPGASLFAAVRSASAGTRLKAEGRQADAQAAWARAVDELSGALGPGAPDSVAAGARALLGHVLRGAGRPADAADAFLASSGALAGERAGDARWMAVVCLDEASRGGDREAAARADRVVDAIVAELPTTNAAVRARAWRVTRGDQPPAADIDELLGGSVPPELAPAARRAAIEGLYRRFRGSAGDARRAAARRALVAGDDEPPGAGDAGTVALRQRVEMALALDDRVRAVEAVEALGARVEPGGPRVDAPAAPRCQVAALEGRLEAAQGFAAELPAGSPWARVASGALVMAVTRDPTSPPEARATVLAGAVRGQRPPPVTETALWLRAESELARRGQPGVDRAGALAAAEAARASAPADAGLLLAEADFRLATGDPAASATSVERVLATQPVGTEAWFDAKAMQVEAVARSDPSRARAMLEQVRALTGGLGSGSAGERLLRLDGSLPGRASTGAAR